MKNQMLTPALKTLALLLLISTFSCDKDDEKEPIPVDEFNTEYNNTKYNITNGFVEDGGAVDLFLDDEATEKTHYNYTMVLADGSPEIEGDDVVSMNDGEIVLFVALLSPGTEGFKSGVFEFLDWGELIGMEEEEISDAYKDEYLFPLALIITDSDGDKNWEEESAKAVEEGSFKVSGSAPNYTVEYDLILDDNSTVKGKFTGNFTAVPQ